MSLIGMSEAARRAGVTRPGIRNALQVAGVPLVKVSDNAFAVEESDLAAFLAQRGDTLRPGRPPGAKNKPKPAADESAAS